MNKVNNLGKIGEDISCRIVEKLGFTIIKRNYRTKFGEIDIIGNNKEILVFFEVKTLINKNVCQIIPEDNMSRNKIEKLNKICNWFSNQNPELINPDYGWRIDLLAILIDQESKSYTYKHYMNVV